MGIANKILIRNKGNLTLPADLRRKYALNTGDVLTLVDLGNGAFFLSTTISELDRLGDMVAERLRKSGVTLDEILVALDEERERYYQERYAKS